MPDSVRQYNILFFSATVIRTLYREVTVKNLKYAMKLPKSHAWSSAEVGKVTLKSNGDEA
jgi:hypothetical protein